MLPVMFGSVEVATLPAGAPAGAHIVLPVGFALFAVIGVAPLLLFALRAIIAKISIPSARANAIWSNLRQERPVVDWAE